MRKISIAIIILAVAFAAASVQEKAALNSRTMGGDY
jgi:hypothetical protein